MVTLVCLVRRKPGLPEEEFHAHWREHHGPLLRGTGVGRRLLVSYRQLHRLPESADPKGRPVGAEGWDGAAVLQFASVDDYWAFVSSDEYRDVIAPDEDRFLDRGSLVWLLTDENAF